MSTSTYLETINLKRKEEPVQIFIKLKYEMQSICTNIIMKSQRDVQINEIKIINVFFSLMTSML